MALTYKRRVETSEASFVLLMHDVSIVIPNWNGRELLHRFLPSALIAAKRYQEQFGQKTEIVVVDDGSTDDSVSWFKKEYGHDPLMRLVVRDHNGGFVPAANSGFAAARHRIVFLINNDVSLSPDAIAPLVRLFEDETVFAVCSRALRIETNELDGAGKLGTFKNGFWRVFENYEVRDEHESLSGKRWPSFFGSGGYTAYDGKKLSLVGGFNELLAPFYWEDVDICYRAWKRGWVVEYEPRSVVYHLGSATMKKEISKSKLGIVAERNRLLMTWVNLHDPFWFSEHVAWLGLKLLGAALTLDLQMWRSFIQALRRLSKVLPARRIEKSSAVRSDREIAAIFEKLRAGTNS
ncbi:MAG: glycosyltransferase family 2 protein [Acidobacteriia bacterium]|nr:glycosyltransferase family 2 protein [Terriglobia bacterium]